jgi:Cu(I)/Ag(I) efflux system membrane fusion protein
MKTNLRASRRAALAAAVLAIVATLIFPSWAADTLTFEAPTPEVAVGDAVRVDIRVLDASGQPVTSPVAATALRLDMGPDGMAGMTTRVVAVPTDQPGVIALEADFTMAGRWALTLTATVNGGEVTGTVTLTAVKKAAEATPAAPAAGERRIVYYRHPMGLPDTSPVPKKDQMGMDYIPVYEDELAGPPGSVMLTPAKIQRSGIRTVLATRTKVMPVARGFGVIAIDERRQAMLSVKFEGFIEELYVAATGEVVSAGQPLAKVWIESPDILQKEADFLSSLRSGNSERAAANLRLFGIPDEVIAELRRSGTPVREFVLKAAHGGTVTDKQAVPGMRFAAGELLYMVADLSQLWLTAEFSETDLGAIAVGQTATVRLNAGGTAVTGRVAFVYPSLDMAARTGRVRIEIANPDGELKVGQYADVAIDVSGTGADVVAVPDSAVLDSGRRQIVFIANDAGLFLPRDVTVGRRGDGMVEVRTGLSEGERVVVSGNFLLDAESNLRTALSGMTTTAAP